MDQPQPEDRRNSEIDFREFFSLPGQGAPLAPDQLPPFAAGPPPETRGRYRIIPRIGWAAAANITFAAIALAGGLFCSFHFFNSADPPRIISVFPPRFAHERPFVLKRELDIDTSDSNHARLRAERTVNNLNPHREGARSGSVQSHSEPARPERRGAFIPTANFTPNLSSARANQASRAGSSSAVANRASTSATSMRNSGTKGNAKADQPKTARAPGNTGSDKKGSAQHTQGTVAKLNRTAPAYQHSAQFDRAKQAMDRMKPTHDLGARTMGGSAGPSSNAGSSFRMSPNLSRGSR